MFIDIYIHTYVVVKSLILLIDFYFLVEISLCLDGIIITNSLILGICWPYKGIKIIKRLCPIVHVFTHL